MSKIDFSPKSLIVGILVLAFISYAGFQARFVILGPRVEITSHKNGEVVENPLVTIEGKATNISWISLNGRQIFTDEKGYWSEDLVVSKGINVVTVKVKGKMGEGVEKEKSVQIIYNN
jgi:hypothetical protein